MGTRIHYASGKTLELPGTEDARFMKRATNAGFRYYKTLDGKIIPFNHPSIEFIEPFGEPVQVEPRMKPAKPMPEPPPTPEEVKMLKEQDILKQDKKSKEERRKQLEADFMARANCKHKDGNGVTIKKLRYVGTATGRKYFPVCTFCGHRGRYVGVPKIEAGDHPIWTMKDVEEATHYEEK